MFKGPFGSWMGLVLGFGFGFVLVFEFGLKVKELFVLYVGI